MVRVTQTVYALAIGFFEMLCWGPLTIPFVMLVAPSELPAFSAAANLDFVHKVSLKGGTLLLSRRWARGQEL